MVIIVQCTIITNSALQQGGPVLFWSTSQCLKSVATAYRWPVLLTLGLRRLATTCHGKHCTIIIVHCTIIIVHCNTADLCCSDLPVSASNRWLRPTGGQFPWRWSQMAGQVSTCAATMAPSRILLSPPPPGLYAYVGGLGAMSRCWWVSSILRHVQRLLSLLKCSFISLSLGFERYRYWGIGNWAIFACIG